MGYVLTIRILESTLISWLPAKEAAFQEINVLSKILI
jgi:hypothetical protein